MMLKVDNLNVYYGAIHAIKDVSFEVKEGEIVTLIGANGAGKSTILKTVSGLLHSKGGSIEFMGEQIGGIPPHKVVAKGLAQVPEGRRVFTQMTVEENLEMGGYIQPGNQIEAGLQDVYKRFPRLQERRRQTAGTLSGGEQQMVAIARGMMCGPKLLMLDEPSLGLMPKLVEEVFSFVQRINKLGTTIVIVEQNVNETLKFADYAYIVSEGEIALHGTPQELMKDDEIRRIYLGH